MNDVSRQSEDDLTADWPPDAANVELARFARSLQSAAPQLPAAAMSRIAEAIEQELDHQAARRRLFRVVSAMAATLLLGVAGWVLVSRFGGTVPPSVVEPTGPVIDRYAVTPEPVPTLAKPQRPLISLEEYRALVGEEQVAER